LTKKVSTFIHLVIVRKTNCEKRAERDSIGSFNLYRTTVLLINFCCFEIVEEFNFSSAPFNFILAEINQLLKKKS